MKSSPNAPAVPVTVSGRPWLAFALLVGILGLLFLKSCAPGQVHFSNDGPLGAATADHIQPPGAFTGVWNPLNWVGNNGGSSSPNFTNLLFWLLGPVGFAKFYAPISILTLGLCAWLAFRQLRFAPVTCTVGALAAALNGGFFSYACWGLGTLTLTIAAFFLALAAWGAEPERRSWMRVVLAGFAIGLGIMEGFDHGAILSVFFAGYVLARTWAEHPGKPAALAGGVLRLAIVTIMAGVFAFHALFALITTQIQGVAGMAQDADTRRERWLAATMGSVPKAETLRLFVAGLYGYRMDTPEGGQYWGGVGRHPAWDEYFAQANPQASSPPDARGGGLRHSGSGFYCGVFVCLLAAWAVLRSITGGGVYQPGERKTIWFWAAAALVSLLLSWGRHAPFYAIVYEIPYFSTIRNPFKFLHPLNVSLVILFAYGVEGLWRSWGQRQPKGNTVKARFGDWWRGAAGFDRYWIIGSAVLCGMSLFALVLYASMKGEMTKFFEVIGPIDPQQSPGLAAAMFRHSLVEILWSLLFLFAGCVVVALLMSGAQRRTGAGTAGFVAVLLLTGLDLVRSNLPWIQHYNYRDRYVSAPLYEFLANKPWEHRVQLMPGLNRGFLGGLVREQFVALQELAKTGRMDPRQLQELARMLFDLGSVYSGEWHQHQFQYFNIQSLDLVQEPRPPIENEQYRAQFPVGDAFAELRLARLTSTRYFLGLGAALEPLNQQARAEGGEFREVMPVWVGRNGDYYVPVPDTNNPCSLLEFTGALPRARLYANWQVETDSTNVLTRLAGREFDPGKLVLVEGECPPPASPEVETAGIVGITEYHPKFVKMSVNATVPSVLLFNDKFDAGWKATVDGRPATILKANFLMRGLHVPAGAHEVVWRFEPPRGGLYVSLSAIGVGLLLTGLTVMRERKAGTTSDSK